MNNEKFRLKVEGERMKKKHESRATNYESKLLNNKLQQITINYEK